jgi:hypothetical protein
MTYFEMKPTIPELACRNLGKQEILVRVKFEPGPSRIKCMTADHRTETSKENLTVILQ